MKNRETKMEQPHRQARGEKDREEKRMRERARRRKRGEKKYDLCFLSQAMT